VIQVADIALIAISIYQVAKTPVVPAGSSPTPPTILGTLPGGAAVGSAVSLPSLARALEAIRKLVAIGALDGALVAGVGMSSATKKDGAATMIVGEPIPKERWETAKVG
jgi:hypothetical protein